MSEISAQDVIQAAVEAQDKGVSVNWQQHLFQYHNAAVAELARKDELINNLQDELDDLKLKQDGDDA